MLLICSQTIILTRYDSAKFFNLKCSLELKYLDKLAFFFYLRQLQLMGQNIIGLSSLSSQTFVQVSQSFM